MTKLRKILNLCMCLTLAVFLTSCASAHNQDPTTDSSALSSLSIADPLEPLNRGVTKFNNAVDLIILDPLALGYNAILPKFARDGIGNFLANLRSPLYIANNLLQGDVGGAGVSASRFLINSTIGLGGFIDVAKRRGLNHETEDFGQTLAKWGVGEGFYIVWPILGPASLRDSIGTAVDSLADPVRIVAFDEGEESIFYIRNGVEGLHTKAAVVDIQRDLRKDSLDYYATIKSVYEQRRIALIYDRDTTSHQNADTPVENGYDEYDALDQ